MVYTRILSGSLTALVLLLTPVAVINAKCVSPERLAHSSVWVGGAVGKDGNAKGVGSAFTLTPTLLLTNKHVAKDVISKNIDVWVQRPLITYAHQRMHERQNESLSLHRHLSDVRVVHFDDTYDIALLEVRKPLLKTRPVRLARSKPTIGSWGLSIGHPNNEAFSIVMVRFIGTMQFTGEQREKFTSAKYRAYYSFAKDSKSRKLVPTLYKPGSSGAPIFNCRGELVGMHTIFSNLYVNFGIPHSVIAELVSRIRIVAQ